MAIVTIMANLTVKEECLDIVKQELLKMIAPTRQEPGCLEYRLHQDNTNPTVFVFYENWQDMDSFEQHMVTPHFKSYAAAVADKLVSKTVHRMTRLA